MPFFSGNAIPTPFLPRLCLLAYFTVFYRDMQYKFKNAFPNLEWVPEPLFLKKALNITFWYFSCTSNVPSKLAHVSTHTGRETSARKKTSAHKCSFQKCFLLIFHTFHSKFRWVLEKCCTTEILCAHRLYKLEGTLLTRPETKPFNIAVVFMHIKLNETELTYTYTTIS